MTMFFTFPRFAVVFFLYSHSLFSVYVCYEYLYVYFFTSLALSVLNFCMLDILVAVGPLCFSSNEINI